MLDASRINKTSKGRLGTSPKDYDADIPEGLCSCCVKTIREKWVKKLKQTNTALIRSTPAKTGKCRVGQLKNASYLTPA